MTRWIETLAVTVIVISGCNHQKDHHDEIDSDVVDEDGSYHTMHDAETDSDADTTPALARWTVAVFMNGDNDLEYLVSHDLNELEVVGSGDGVHVLVQADRIDGYVIDDGDWTGTRRYYITADDTPEQITSQVVVDLGERDMGDPHEVDDFLLWAHENYPAEHMALIFWNHGDGWAKKGDDSLPAPMPIISIDETNNSELSVAGGDLRTALTNIVAVRGPLDLVGFDACNMASWEVAHSLSDLALYMTGSEALVDEEGYQYAPALELLRDVDAAPDGAALAVELARSAVERGGEWTHAAIDLSALGELNEAVDALAATVLDEPVLRDALLQVRRNTRSASVTDRFWYLDLADLGRALRESHWAQFQVAGEAINHGIDTAVLGAWGNDPYAWTRGLTIFFAYEYSDYLASYAEGAGATWARETRWDDLILLYAGM